VAAPSARKGTRGLQRRLTAKVGPLPVWGWAAAILAAYFLYSRMRPPAATTSNDVASASTPDGSTGSAQVPASGQGSPADNMNGDLLGQLGANTAAIDALTSQILSASPFPYEYGDAPAAGSGSVAAQPTVQTASTPQQVGANAGHATQTAAGTLQWGGLTFTTKAAFDRWAKAHGTTAAAEFKTHPQARAIYGTLR